MAWTRSKIRKLKAGYPTADLQQLATQLQVTIAALKSKAQCLGLRRAVQRHDWTAEDLALLMQLYPETPNKAIADRLHTSVNSVENKAHRLGLRKTKAYLSQVGAEHAMHPNIVATQFKKGTTPKNKGKRQTDFMSHEKIENSKATRFKPGNIPHNTKPIGYETVRNDGYVYVKTEHGMQKKHRLVWEQHHGEIPEDMRVIFLDGDRTNCTLENLALTDAAEAAAIQMAKKTQEERKLMQQKANITRNKTIESDKRRIRWGLPPRSKLVKRYYKCTNINNTKPQ